MIKQNNTYSKNVKAYYKSEPGIIKLKDRAAKRIKTQQLEFIYHFYHENNGDFNISTLELTNKFPEQKLNSSNLVKVGDEDRTSHKGWILYKNRNIGINGFLEIKHKKNVYCC